jgi:hypothetical protein
MISRELIDGKVELDQPINERFVRANYMVGDSTWVRMHIADLVGVPLAPRSRSDLSEVPVAQNVDQYAPGIPTVKKPWEKLLTDLKRLKTKF